MMVPTKLHSSRNGQYWLIPYGLNTHYSAAARPNTGEHYTAKRR